MANDAAELVRWPHRLGRESFYRVAYPVMFLSRRLDERLLELYQKGYVKGTVTMGFGNEATAVGMSMPLRPGRDVLSVLHRDSGPTCCWASPPIDSSANIWPMPTAPRMPARAMSIMATPQRGGSP